MDSAPPPGVVHRAGTMAKVKLRFQSARQIQFGMVDGGWQILAKRKMRSDGG